VIARLLHGVLVTLALFGAAPGVRAEVLRKVVDELIEAPSPDAAVGQVNDAALASFKAALAVYDRQIEQQPWDVVTRLARCRFMLDFAGNYEIAEFATEISEQGQECQTQVDQAYPDHPETKLAQLQANMYGGDGLRQAEEVLLDAQKRNSWSNGQLGRLYSLLAQGADTKNDSGRALRYSLLALELDEESEVRLIAARRLVAAGDKKRAIEILRSPIDVFEEDPNGWLLLQKMRLLMQAGASQDAMALYSRLKQVRYYNHSEAADLLLSVGASALAREELEAAVENGKYSAQDEGARFRLELQYGTADAAHAAYQAWRDLGWKVDPLGVTRAALFARDPSQSLRFRDVTGVFTFLGSVLLLALAAAVPIVAVHYRGLVVRARTSEPYPQANWALRSAWLALSAFFVSSVLALYFGGALDLRINDGTTLWQFEPTPVQFSRIGLASSLLGLALMMPFAGSSRRREGTWWSTQWSIGKCLLIGAAIAVALRLPQLLVWATKPDAIHSFALDNALWQMLNAVHDRYGYFAVLWIVAIAAPVTEEFLFRGVLYRAFMAHLRPLWANVLQAALFAAMHLEGFLGSLTLFVLGLTLGTLTRRSGGLLAAMTLHAIFNLIAALIILRG
jgi:membrane protease YdiL (CAAX protease family)